MVDIDVLFTILFGLVIIYGAILQYKYRRLDNVGLPSALYRRRILASTLSVGGVLLWLFCSALYLHYDRTRSNIATAQSGTVYALTNHGHVVYVTLVERGSLPLLVVSSGLLFVSG